MMEIASLDLLWAIVAGVLIIMGFIGCLLPIIPGPPISYLGLLVMQLWETPPFTTQFMLIWLGITVGVTAMDYLIPIWGAKRFGGSKAGIIGSTLGLIVGFAFGPVGIILGPAIGAFIGEAMSGKSRKEAARAGLGAFIGFVTGTLLKLVVSSMMAYHYVDKLF